MKVCERLASGEVELYFYGELEGRARAATERHVKSCGECRHALDDLSTIRAALSTRPVVDVPRDGDWTRFMAKLEAAIDLERTRIVPIDAPRALPAGRAWQTWQLAAAAVVALIAMSAYVMRSGNRDEAPAPIAAVVPDISRSLDLSAQGGVRTAGGTTIPVNGSAEAAFAALSEQHFEKSKLVVLGLANKDARRVRGADWEYERQLATSLLSDTRVYRLAAEDRGLTTLAKVMGDLELVLLQTSTAEQTQATDLEQIQRLIEKRDLVTKMDAVTSAGI
jgi:hypothetical protein